MTLEQNLCSKCGNENSNEAITCSSCGVNLKDEPDFSKTEKKVVKWPPILAAIITILISISILIPISLSLIESMGDWFIVFIFTGGIPIILFLFIALPVLSYLIVREILRHKKKKAHELKT